ncbi:MAG: hypothetical protein WEC82_05110 [Xanthobacteraceae bacterium]
MAQRPLPEMIRLAARVPRGEAGYWQIMLALDARHGSFTVPDVEGESNVKAGAVAQYLRKLVKGGFAKQDGERPAPARPCKVYRLVKKPAEAPRLRADGSPLGRTMTAQLWTAIRSLKQFHPREVAYTATTDRKVPVATANAYMRKLAAAGYLIGLAGGQYRLKPSMNTGPLAPAILRIHAVFDRNRNEIVGDDYEAEVTS